MGIARAGAGPGRRLPVRPSAGPPNPSLPTFWKGRLEDVEEAVKGVKPDGSNHTWP